MAEPDLFSIHCMAEKIEELSVAIQESAERVLGYLGFQGDPCPDPPASGQSLHSRLLRTIQTGDQAIATLARLERELNYEAVEPPPSRGLAEPAYRS